MRRSHAILVAIFCALSLPARGQAIVTLFKCDHDWSIHYGTNRYGLVQESWSGVPGAFRPWTITTIWLGSRSFSVNHSIWLVAGGIVFPIVCLCWMLIYGLGSALKPEPKPPPSNPSPPP